LGRRGNRRNRQGAEEKALFAVAAEEDGNGIGRIRLRVISDASSASLHEFIREAIAPGSTVRTDGWRGYLGLEGYVHDRQVLSRQQEGEHLRIAQWDILDFSRNPEYKAREWPRDYWPGTQAPPNASAWNKSVKAFQADLQAMCDLVADETTNLYAKIPHGDGQTILREALLAADHNAYHLGEMVLLRRLLGAWK